MLFNLKVVLVLWILLLEGNDCEKFLKKLDKLALWIPSELNEYLDLLVALKSVIESCFRTSGLLPDYKDCLVRFERNAYKCKDSFGLSLVPKLHMIFDHVPYYCEKFGVSLGRYSEQELEASHSSFNKIWQNFKMKNTAVHWWP